jgi:hypothetical protein
MKYNFYTFTVLSVLLLPQLVSAQSVQALLTNTVSFIGTAVVPFLLGIAFVIFVINIVRFFILGADNTDSKDSARSLAIYSIAAFVFLVIFWGIVNMFNSALGVRNAPVQSDYMTGF